MSRCWADRYNRKRIHIGTLRTLSLYALYTNLAVTTPPEDLAVIGYPVTVTERLEGNAFGTVSHSDSIRFYD